MKAAATSTGREHAVVLGGGIAGLLNACAAAAHFRRVTLVEQDAIVNADGCRPGVPQGYQVHGFLARGVTALEQLLPGITGQMAEAGAYTGDVQADGEWIIGGHALARRTSGMRALAASRPFVEAHVRRRVLATANVALLERMRGVGLTVDHPGGPVMGVRLVPRETGATSRELRADLVIDATGRGSQVETWLRNAGHPLPSIEALSVDVGYAGCLYRVPERVRAGRIAVVIGALPSNPRSGVAQIIEGGQMLISVTGYGAARPAPTPEGMAAQARLLASRAIAELIESGEPAAPVESCRMPRTFRRRFDLMKNLPRGFIVVGDSLCAFNPVYAQGMSVSAVEANCLATLLGEQVGAVRPEQFYRAIHPVVAGAWQLASGSDLAIPSVVGKRTLPGKVIGAWVRQVLSTAARDAEVALAFLRAASLVRPPPSLLTPGVALRVLRHRLWPRTLQRSGASHETPNAPG